MLRKGFVPLRETMHGQAVVPGCAEFAVGLTLCTTRTLEGSSFAIQLEGHMICQSSLQNCRMGLCQLQERSALASPQRASLCAFKCGPEHSWKVSQAVQGRVTKRQVVFIPVSAVASGRHKPSRPPSIQASALSHLAVCKSSQYDAQV